MKENQHPVRDAARLWAAAVIATAHLSFFFLDVVGKLEFTVKTEYTVIMGVASHWVWGPLFLFTGLGILVSLGVTRWLRRFLSLAFAVMGVWSFFTLLWGLYPIREVSLVGPVLGLVVAALSQTVSLAYTDTEGD